MSEPAAPAPDVDDGLLGLPTLARDGTDFTGPGPFLGLQCTQRERKVLDGAIVLAAVPETGSWQPAFQGLNSTYTLDVATTLWLYIAADQDMSAQDIDLLLAGVDLWKSSGRSDIGFDGVPAGGALFIYGTCQPPAELGQALGLQLPSLPLSAAVVFGGGVSLGILRLPLLLPGDVVRDPALEIASPLGPSLAGLELRLRGTVVLDNDPFDISFKLPIGAGPIIGSFDYQPSGSLQGLLPFEIPAGTDVSAEIELAAASGQVTLQRVSFGLELGPISLLPALVLDRVQLGVARFGSAAAAVWVATIEAQATFGTTAKARFDCRASFPPGQLTLALAQGSSLDVNAILADLGCGNAAADLPEVVVTDASLSYDASSGSVAANLEVTCDWTVGPFTFRALTLSAGAGTLSVGTQASLGSGGTGVSFLIVGTHTGAGYGFTGHAVTAATLAQLLAGLEEAFGEQSLGIPAFLAYAALTDIAVSCSGTSASFDCTLQIDENPVVVTLTGNKAGGTWTVQAGGTITIGTHEFGLQFTKAATGDSFSAAYPASGGSDPINLVDLATSLGVDASKVLGSVQLDRAVLSYSSDPSGNRTVVVVADTAEAQATIVRYVATDAMKTLTAASLRLKLDVGLSDVPAFGAELAELSGNAGLAGVVVRAASRPLDSDDLNLIAPAVSAAGAPPLTTGQQLDEVELEADLQLGNEVVPVALAAPAPAGAGAATAAAAGGSGAAGTTIWRTVERTFGPLSIQQVGLSFAEEKVWLVLDASLVLSVVELDLLGLAIGVPLALPPASVSAALDGFAISAPTAPVQISGGLLRQTVDGRTEFDGQLSIQAAEFDLMALGSYTIADGAPSLFAFAVLDKPLGGPAFLYVTGVAAGFGVNRDLVVPDVLSVGSFPLVAAAMGSSPLASATTVAEAVTAMGTTIPPKAGENWVAAGVRFTSCGLVESVALLTARFGQASEIDLLGTSVLAVPPGAPDPIAYAQLDIKGSLQPDQGAVAIVGELTPASYILAPGCQLTGGFAFCSWWKDQAGTGARAGDFVVTLGGYHPAFTPPAWYPAVPRLGAVWQSGDLVLKGQYYFALTPNAVMGGGAIEATWNSGPVSAWFDARADFLLCWKPFHYQAEVAVEIGASVEVDLLFTSFTVSASVGIDLTFYGPPFGGQAHVDLYVCSFTISFGAGPPAVHWIPWPEFRDSFLPPGDDGVCGAHVTGGLLKDLSQANGAPPSPPATSGASPVTGAAGGYDWIVSPERFELTTYSAIPVSSLTIKGAPGPAATASPVPFGVGPVGLRDGELTSTHTIELVWDDGVLVPLEATPVARNVPAAAWSFAAATAANAADMSSLQAAPAMIEGAVTGYVLRPSVEPPDVTCPVDLDRLLSQDDPVERDFAWSSETAAAQAYSQANAEVQLEQALQATAPATALRSAILQLLTDDGVVPAGTTVDVQQFAASATTVLMAAPVLSALGAAA